MVAASRRDGDSCGTFVPVDRAPRAVGPGAHYAIFIDPPLSTERLIIDRA